MMTSRLEAANRPPSVPPVVTGLACRLPGAPSVPAFWDLLISGRSAISQVGADRFAAARYLSQDTQETGTSYTFRAGVLEDVWSFDPGFFGFSHREARQMDPQQRLLLQVAWEAVEDAGLRPSTLERGRTGVFVGASSSDYSTRFLGDPARVDAPFMLGNTLSILSNRISYTFDMTGPSYTVDTACSSSFYALDQARRALEAGEIDTALVGSVNVLLSPLSFIGFSRAGMLSPDGLCKAFDAGANGYVRSEGAVAMILRRADVAATNGDRVVATLRSTGINSDGRTNGIALPSADSQARLMRRLSEESGIDPDTIAFAEAHGTGTRAGDLAEATSLGQVYGQSRKAPLLVGSAKTNVGHLEPASGLVGLLKAVLALRHGILPASLNLATPNPDIDFEDLNIEVATTTAELPDREKAPLAVVNSFGFGGANAHVIIEAAPRATTLETAAAAPLILTAASEAALGAMARGWADRLATATQDEGARLINQAAWRRERLGHALLASGSVEEIAAGLAEYGAGHPAPAIRTGKRAASRKTAFVFSGNGSQWAGMGRHLFETDPVFRRAFERVSELFVAEDGPDLVNLLSDPALETALERSSVGQASLFALQVALVDSLAAAGMRPDAVSGHSVGEVAAAWTAGALSLSDAVHLIQSRATTLESLYKRGGMAAVLGGREAVAEALEAFRNTGDLEDIDSTLVIAADNNPRSTTVSGSTEAIDRFAKFARKLRLAVKRLDVQYPYHSPAVEEVRKPLLSRIRNIAPRDTKLTFVSSTTGRQVVGQDLTPDFWWRNTRNPVLFRQAVETLTATGCGVFVEIGPRPVLQNYVVESASASGAAVQYVPTQEQGRNQKNSIAQIVARMISVGATHDEQHVFGAPVPFTDTLPHYPWQNAEFRAEPTGAALRVTGEAGVEHPLLGWRVHAATPIWHNCLSLGRQPWLADHKVGDAVVFPAAGFAELALAAGHQHLNTTSGIELTGLDILQPLLLDRTVEIRTRLDPDSGVVKIESSPYPDSDPWTLHAQGRVSALIGHLADTSEGLSAEDATVLDGDRLYKALSTAGLNYGDAFRGFRSGRMLGKRLVADLATAADHDGEFLLDPRLLDSSMHGLLALAASALGIDSGAGASSGEVPVYLPIRIGKLKLARNRSVASVAEVSLERVGAVSLNARIVLRDRSGALVAEVSDLRLRAMPQLSVDKNPPEYWRQVLVRLTGPEPSIVRPASWQDAAGRLTELGLWSDQPVTPTDAALLSDAAARRLCWDMVLDLTGGDGLLDEARLAGLPDSAHPILLRMIMALEEDGLFDRDDGRKDGLPLGQLALNCPFPAFDELLRGLRDETPDRADLLLRLSEVAEELPQALFDGLPDAPTTGRSADIALRCGWSGLETALGDLCGQWEADKRLTVLVLGQPPAGMVARLEQRAPCARILVSALADEELEQFRRANPDVAHCGLAFDSLTARDDLAGNVDLIVSGDDLWRADKATLHALRSRLAGGGILLAAHRPSELLSDLIEGRSADWWVHGARTSSAAGRRPSGHGFASFLRGSGFAGAEIRQMTAADAGQVLAMAIAEEAPQLDAAPDAIDAAERSPLIFYSGNAEQSRGTAIRDELRRLGLKGAATSAISRLIGVPEEPWDGVLLVPTSGADTLSVAENGIAIVQDLMQRLPNPARLWIVISGGCPVAAKNAGASPAAAALWGFARTLTNEYPGIEIRLIDPGDPEPTTGGRRHWAQRVATSILNPTREHEVLLDENGVAAPRVKRVTRPGSVQPANRRLVASRPGSLDSLVWQQAPRRPPADHEVEIVVRAVGLNFRDVMWAQGMLPEEALENGFAGAALGMECAGVVTRAGPSSGFADGDRVVAFASGAFANYVTVDAGTVARMPEWLDFERAATLPTVFATAKYAIDDLIRLREGEEILIHGGAGGVGLAALQLAKARGARVIVSAGTPVKRRLLKAFGADHVVDSRRLTFTDEVRALAGDGVDAVLNSLAGEAMERSIGCLRPFGRFVELGKRDFFADTRIGLYPFHRNLSYFGVDLDELIAARPEKGREIFDDLSSFLVAGTGWTPPYTAFEAEETISAFRLMQRSGHLGKIVIRPPRRKSGARPEPRIAGCAAPIRDGWLIVGGTRGLGLKTAASLAARGARKLWLASRSGETDPAERADLERVLGQNVVIETLSLDVTDQKAVEKSLAQMERDDIPLRGIVHSAMVLRDRPAHTLTAEDTRAVLAPKIKGAEILDRASRNRGLDHFVMFSSVVTLFGNPNQAPYVAANMALERIAQNRRAAGEPGLAIGWGAIRDSGYLTRDDTANQVVDAMLDGAFLSSADAMSALAEVQANDTGTEPELAAVTYARVPWHRLARDLRTLSTPLFEEIGDLTAPRPEDEGTQALRERLASLDDRAAIKEIFQMLVAQAAGVLHQPESEIDLQRPLNELGFDSLMAVELRLSLEEKIGLSLPLLTLAGATSMTDVAVKILDSVRRGAAGDDQATETLDDLIAQHTSGDNVETTLDTEARDRIRRRARDLNSSESPEANDDE